EGELKCSVRSMICFQEAAKVLGSANTSICLLYRMIFLCQEIICSTKGILFCGIRERNCFIASGVERGGSGGPSSGSCGKSQSNTHWEENASTFSSFFFSFCRVQV